jgi:hypothetical protein
MKLLPNRYTRLTLTRSTKDTKCAAQLSPATKIAISDLDLYLKYGSFPVEEGFLRHRSSLSPPTIPNAALLSTAEYTKYCVPSPNVVPDKTEAYEEPVPQPEPQFSPFESNNTDAGDLMTPYTEYIEIAEEPTESLGKISLFRERLPSIAPKYETATGKQSFFESILKFWKPRSHMAMPKFEYKISIGEDRESKANFNTDVTFLTYDEQEPLSASSNVSLPHLLKRSKSFNRYKRRPVYADQKPLAETMDSKSILKSKVNLYEESERRRAAKYDSLNVDDFISELEEQERLRFLDSVQYPFLRKLQISKYGDCD